MLKKHELDQFMIALENAGILTGWSKFMGYGEPKAISDNTGITIK